jgi:ATP-dependent Clp protease ATP-binding subunit ClpC
MKAKVFDALKTDFKPEFLNRVDEVIVFEQLTKDELVEILDLLVARLDARLKEQYMAIELTREAKELLLERAHDPAMGARPLRRAVQRELEDYISEKLLYGDFMPGQKITVGAKKDKDGDNEFEFTTTLIELGESNKDSHEKGTSSACKQPKEEVPEKTGTKS